MMYSRLILVTFLVSSQTRLYAVPQPGAPLQFEPAVNLEAEQTPFSIAVGDFNLDGNPDIVVANNGSGTVSILLGNGDGTFEAMVDYPAGASPFSVRIGDFNRDGKPDLAVANGPLLSPIGTVSVLLGNGDGTFRQPVEYATQTGSTSLVVADFNGDGLQDLATTNYTNTLSVLLGNGDGTFRQAMEIGEGGSNAYFIAGGDFNNDGIVDLVTANNGSNDLSVLLGHGDGTFETSVEYSVGTNPHCIAVGDFNGDGRDDLVAVNTFDGTFSVLLGNGDGTFQSAVNYGIGSEPLFAAVEDVNGDGILDLVVVEFGGNEVSVLLGNGDGTFQPASNYSVQNQPRPVAITDLNGDGRADMVVGNQASGTVTVLLGTPQNPPLLPLITSILDAEGRKANFIPGEWVSIFGLNLATTTRSWSNSDFDGQQLPIGLSGASVEFDGTPAAISFISPTQLNVQVPSVVSGPVAVHVVNNGVTGADFGGVAGQNAPSIFNYAAGTLWYAAAVHADGTIVGDPSVLSSAEKASPGETIAIFVDGLAPSPAGSLINQAITYPEPLVVTVGQVQTLVVFAGVTEAGEFQLNVQVPPGLGASTYPISVAAAGQTSPPGVVLPVGP